jgi:Cu-processing system permease protein
MTPLSSTRPAISAGSKIFSYELSDVARNNGVIAYAVFFALAAEGFFRFSGGSEAVLLGMMNVVLFLVPLVCAVFGTMYLYDARTFNELMLSQPVRRSSLFFGLYTGLAVPLAASFAVGVSLPFVLRGAVMDNAPALALLLAIGVLLTFVFVGLAALVSTTVQDKVRGLAVSVIGWLFFAVAYDGLVLVFASAFAHYPLEKPMIGLAMLNPIDLGRILLMLQFDISALMGYTGAVFQQFFGSPWGMALSFAVLVLWILIPVNLALRAFQKKDF